MAMAMTEAEVECPIQIIEHGHISPPPNSVPTSSLPLSFLDVKWINFTNAQRVFFYEFPHSNPKFAQTIIPALKSSLSAALGIFYPFVGKIVAPPLPSEPQIVYTDGDSVPFMVAESTLNLHELTSNDPQDVQLLSHLVPQRLPWRISEDGTYTTTPLLAVQVTLFPNSGICIGLTFNHAICDGNGFHHFVKSWASICRTGKIEGSLPFLDRGIVEDPNDFKTLISKEWWDNFAAYKNPNPSSSRHILAKQRATFVFSKTTINQLKSWISNRSIVLGLEPLKISSFAAVYAFTWVCTVKSTLEQEQPVPPHYKENVPVTDDTDIRYLLFAAECRRRLKTPLPETYFGNCLVGLYVAMQKKVLLGKDGTVFAANAIARQVKELETGGAERCVFDNPTRKADFRFEVAMTVAGSPRLAIYDTDFGWGRPKKSAVPHVLLNGSISLAESRDEEGGIEVDIALTKDSMDQFTTLFNQLDSSHLM